MAEDDGLLIGVAELSLRRDVVGLEGTGYVEGVFVRPAFRGARRRLAVVDCFAGVGRAGAVCWVC